MFSDNGRISHRQLKRQMLLGLCGVLLLFMTGDLLQAGRSGVLGVLLGAAVLLVYLWWTAGCEHAQKKSARKKFDLYFWAKLVVMGSFLVITGAYLLRESVRVTSEYLLPEAGKPILALILLAVAVLGVGTVPERRARMAEAAFPMYFWGILLLLVLAAFHARVPDIRQMPALSIGEIMSAGWSFLAVGITVTAFPMIGLELSGEGDNAKNREKKKPEGLQGEKEIDNELTKGEMTKLEAGVVEMPVRNQKNRRSVERRVWITLALLVVGTILVLFGTYGYSGANSLEFPLWHLMSGTNLPGKFLERFDIIWMSLFLFGILFALGSVAFYGVQILPEFRGHTVIIQVIVSVLVGVYWMVTETFPELQVSYLLAVKCIYAPLFLVLVILRGRERGSREQEIKLYAPGSEEEKREKA